MRDGLRRPTGLVPVGDELVVCESGRPGTGRVGRSTTLAWEGGDGYVRGLAIDHRDVVIGLSRVRRTTSPAGASLLVLRRASGRAQLPVHQRVWLDRWGTEVAHLLPLPPD